MSSNHIASRGMIHDWDCPACVAEDDRRRASRAALVNPHRPGSQVHAKFERERFAGLNASDPRTETYWSM